MLTEEDYKDLQALLSLASTTLQEAKQTLRNGPDHWAKEQIEKMLSQLKDDINVATSLVNESYIVVASDHLLSEDAFTDG